MSNLAELKFGLRSFRLSSCHFQFVCLFVCLFVRDSDKIYCTERHQTLRDYKVRLRECPAWVEITRIAVLEEISYYRFFVRG